MNMSGYVEFKRIFEFVKRSNSDRSFLLEDIRGRVPLLRSHYAKLGVPDDDGDVVDYDDIVPLKKPLMEMRKK